MNRFINPWIKRGLEASASGWFLGLVILWMVLAPRSYGALLSLSTNATRHWAFRPIQKAKPPESRDDTWSENGIDRWVWASLQSHGLEPSPAAERRALLRRLSFDLTGLPPSPEELAGALSDSSPEVIDRWIDRLLASPHFGERWGRHWLDVARYADNKGYVFFEEKTYPWAYTYRDYVVRAFNEDLPYDRFITEQLAADQLELGKERRPLAAMGFITVGDHLVNNTHDIVDDRIDVVSRGLLGLTVACTRCHDHKFDPISQKDYYALYGVFRSSYEPLVPPSLELPACTEEYEGFELELRSRERALEDFVTQKHREIVSGGRSRVGEYLVAVHAARSQPITENFMVLTDKGEANPTVLLRWRLYLEQNASPTNAIWAPWHAWSEIPESEFVAKAAERWRSIADQLPGGGRLNPRVKAIFEGALPASFKEVAERYGKLLKEVNEQWQAQLSAASTSHRPGPVGFENVNDEALRQVLYGPTAPPDVPGTMDWGFISLLPDRASQAEFQALITKLEQWLMHGPQAPPRAMVLQDTAMPYDAKVFKRGNPNRPGDSVTRRFVEFLHPEGAPFSHGSGRLELAREIVSPSNPLTARVFVNRVWLHLLGVGLVGTPSDFGLRSDPPSHPELLDYLASEFIRNGWSVKKLIRLIVTSNTYRQASLDRPAAAGMDPENKWLWRANRKRHDFETVRDSLLSVSGRLDPKVGGPPVSFDQPRRTLYAFVDRMDLPSLYSTFDFPSPASTNPQRAQTTVAPQSLYLMNHPSIAGLSEALLHRPDVARLEDKKEKIRRVYALVLARSPDPQEEQLAMRFLEDSSAKAWSQWVHGLLMLNEFVFLD